MDISGAASTDRPGDVQASRSRVSAPTLALPGAVALLLVLAGIALANSTLALQHAWIDGPSWQDSAASAGLAVLGTVLLWRGLRAGDAAGSVLGYAGGTLIWMGFFEWTWANFALWLGVDPLIIDGQAMLPPSMLLVQASTFIFLPLVVLSAANKDTRCRMMLWFRRRLRLQPPAAAPGHRHHAARVSATETVFVIWFIYLLNIALYDPRLLGQGPAVYQALVLFITLWALYLCSRLLRVRDPGLAVRYAIPTAYLLSIPVDAAAQAGWFPAVWVQPQGYPLCAVIAVLVFLASALALSRYLEATPGKGLATSD